MTEEELIMISLHFMEGISSTMIGHTEYLGTLCIKTKNGYGYLSGNTTWYINVDFFSCIEINLEINKDELLFHVYDYTNSYYDICGEEEEEEEDVIVLDFYELLTYLNTPKIKMLRQVPTEQWKKDNFVIRLNSIVSSIENEK